MFRNYFTDFSCVNWCLNYYSYFIYKEINRILLRENIDLRDTLSENDLLDESSLQNLKQLFSAFSDIEKEDEDDENLSEEASSEVDTDE